MRTEFYGGEVEKQRVIDFFKERDELPIIVVPFIFISPDLVHDGAAVQHFNDTLFTPWVKENAAPGVVFRKRIDWSDGAPNQFEYADQFYWISTQKKRHGIEMDWNFQGTGHGKNDSDPILGAHKNMSQRIQLQAGGGLAMLQKSTIQRTVSVKSPQK